MTKPLKRSKLRKFRNRAITVCARFVRYGRNSAIGSRTALFIQVTHVATGRSLCDHIWMPCGVNQPIPNDCVRGDILQFRAIVKKKYQGYYLVSPRKIRIVGPRPPALPERIPNA